MLQIGFNTEGGTTDSSILATFWPKTKSEIFKQFFIKFEVYANTWHIGVYRYLYMVYRCLHRTHKHLEFGQK